MKETKSVGGSFTESQNINKSLLTLGELFLFGSFHSRPVSSVKLIQSKQTLTCLKTLVDVCADLYGCRVCGFEHDYTFDTLGRNL